MGQNQGSLTVNQRTPTTTTPPPPFIASAAENGVSIDPITFRIVLGQVNGQVGNPGRFLSDREEPMNGFTYRITDGGNRQFFIDPPGAGYLYTLGDSDNAKNFLQIRGGNNSNQFSYFDDAGNPLLFIGDTFASPISSLLSPNTTLSVLLDETTNQAQLIAGGDLLTINSVLNNAAFTNAGTNMKLGVNVATPLKNLHVFGTSNQFGATNHASGFNSTFDDPISAVTNAEKGVNITHYGNDGLTGHIRFFKTRNADPSINTATANADQLGGISVFGVDTGGTIRQSHRILYGQSGANATFVSGSIFWQLVNGAGILGNKMFLGPEGQLGLGTVTPVASAKFEIVSTTQGFLPPRMTTAQKNAIAAPATGLFIYDTTLNKLCVFTGVNWETVTSV